jgi:hypothetical protein
MATIAMDVDLALSMMLIGSVAHLCCKLWGSFQRRASSSNNQCHCHIYNIMCVCKKELWSVIVRNYIEEFYRTWHCAAVEMLRFILTLFYLLNAKDPDIKRTSAQDGSPNYPQLGELR